MSLSEVVAVPRNYFATKSNVFGNPTVQLFGPDLKADLHNIRSILAKKGRIVQFFTMKIATQTVKQLLPTIGFRRTHDLSLALYWELNSNSINLPDDYTSYERVRNYLENNE